MRIATLFIVAILAAGCARREPAQTEPRPPEDGGGEAVVRTEFVILKELVKQHAKQGEAGDTNRLAIVERHLRERVAGVPDEGACDEEREILRAARALAEGL